jgi:hypothetical protein
MVAGFEFIKITSIPSSFKRRGYVKKATGCVKNERHSWQRNDFLGRGLEKDNKSASWISLIFFV